MRIGNLKIHWADHKDSEIRVKHSKLYYDDHIDTWYYSNPIKKMYGISCGGDWFCGIIICDEQIRYVEKKAYDSSSTKPSATAEIFNTSDALE